MRRQQLIQRLFANIASIPAADLRDGQLSDAQWDLTAKGASIAETPIWIDDSPEMTPADIRSRLGDDAQAWPGGSRLHPAFCGRQTRPKTGCKRSLP